MAHANLLRESVEISRNRKCRNISLKEGLFRVLPENSPNINIWTEEFGGQKTVSCSMQKVDASKDNNEAHGVESKQEQLSCRFVFNDLYKTNWVLRRWVW